MDTEEPQWQKDLRRELENLDQRYTPENYPVTLETRREFQQALDHLVDRYSGRMDDYFAGERRQFDQDFRANALSNLTELEAEAQKRARTANDLWALREGLRGNRQGIERGDFRETNLYKDQMKELTDRQGDDIEQTSESIRELHVRLDERFPESLEHESLLAELHLSMEKSREEERER